MSICSCMMRFGVHKVSSGVEFVRETVCGTGGSIIQGEQLSHIWKFEKLVDVLTEFIMSNQIHGSAQTHPFWLQHKSCEGMMDLFVMESVTLTLRLLVVMDGVAAHSVTLHVRYAQVDVYFWCITCASRSRPMVTYTMCQLVLSYIKWWPIDTKGLADCTHIVWAQQWGMAVPTHCKP